MSTIIAHEHVPLEPDASPLAARQENCVLHRRDCRISSRAVTEKEAMKLLREEPDGTLTWWQP